VGRFVTLARMLVTRAGLAATCLAVIALAATPPTALADADPASDFLLTQDLFLPYQPPISSALKADLTGVTSAAKKSGYPLKIAIIATAADLGGVPDLFNQPNRYAPFLGREISFNSKGKPLLVVMPAGLATYQAGPRAASAIAKVKVGSGADGLARAAVEAAQKLAAADGHPIRGFKPSSSGSGGGGSSALIFGVPVALLVLTLAIVSYRRAGREDDEDEAVEDSLTSAAPPSPAEPVADVDPADQQQDGAHEDG
jgi:hypothetical protein